MSFESLLTKFKGLRALVVGDLMLDEYVFGKPTRISPEAPVMVIKHAKTTHLPGGAANVCRNLLALGAQASVIGVTGDDEGAALLSRALQEQGIHEACLLKDPSRVTTRKTRVVADHAHQVLRVDQEDDFPISDRLAEALVEAAPEADVIVLSDYLKGTLSPLAVRRLFEHAWSLGIPVVVNPKPRSLKLFAGADLISLNRVEAAEARGQAVDDTNALAAARSIKEELPAKAVLVTLGESGMAASGSADYQVAAPKVEVYDTAGAGDTVVATVALGIAAVGFEREVFELAVQTAACVVQHVGVATPSRAELDSIAARGIL